MLNVYRVRFYPVAVFHGTTPTEEVCAASYVVQPSGSLAFSDTDGEPLLTYAHGSWVSVELSECGTGGTAPSVWVPKEENWVPKEEIWVPKEEKEGGQ